MLIALADARLPTSSSGVNDAMRLLSDAVIELHTLVD